MNHGWDGLFFFMVEPKDVAPKWLPRTHVRLNYGEFTLDQAIGAIKARTQEQGGHFVPMTPAKRAEILQAENEYRSAKWQMSSSEGLGKTRKKIRELFDEIARHCSELNPNNNLSVETEIDFREGTAQLTIVLRNENVSMIVAWKQPYTNSLENSGLYIHEYNGRLIFNSELDRLMYMTRPDQIGETKYEPELSRSCEYGWTHVGQSAGFLSSSALAEKCVIQFLDLIERYNAGKVRRMEY